MRRRGVPLGEDDEALGDAGAGLHWLPSGPWVNVVESAQVPKLRFR